MGQADSDNAGGSGNTGGSGGSTGGGSGGSSGGRGGYGRDTPGSPNAADGKRGSTMGRNGGTATGGGGGNNSSRDTPGAPGNPGRRGVNADGTTPASRARGAMDRHAKEADTRSFGIGKGYSLTGSMISDAEEGAMSPRSMDMAIGMVEGRRNAGLMGSMGSVVGQAAGKLGQALGVSVPGVSTVGQKAFGAVTSSVPNNPESRYGAARAESRMDNNLAQDAAEGVAGMTLGPAGAFAAGAINTAANLNATADIGRLGDAIGMSSPDSPSRAGSLGGQTGTVSAARDAMASGRPGAAPKARGFEFSPVNMGSYKRGLMRNYMK